MVVDAPLLITTTTDRWIYSFSPARGWREGHQGLRTGSTRIIAMARLPMSLSSQACNMSGGVMQFALGTITTTDTKISFAHTWGKPSCTETTATAHSLTLPSNRD